MFEAPHITQQRKGNVGSVLVCRFSVGAEAVSVTLLHTAITFLVGRRKEGGREGSYISRTTVGQNHRWPRNPVGAMRRGV